MSLIFCHMPPQSQILATPLPVTYNTVCTEAGKSLLVTKDDQSANFEGNPFTMKVGFVQMTIDSY